MTQPLNILVTGTSRGIGAAIVAALAAETEGRNPSSLKHGQAAAFPFPADALGAIQAFGPPTPASARAYAPLQIGRAHV